MNTKKIIILFIIAFFLALVVIFFQIIIKNRSNLNKSENIPINDASQKKVGDFPVSDEKKPVIISKKSDTDYFYAKDATSKEDVKKALDEYAQKSSGSAPAKPIGWSRIIGNDNSMVSLDIFSEATGLSINKNLAGMLDKNNYDLVSCSLEGNKRSYGIVLNIKLLPEYPNIYTDEKKFMRDWESSLLKDTHTILFPDISFGQSDLDQKLQFKDGKYRFSSVSLPDGTKSSINYDVLVDSLIIANSLECMDRASSQIEAVDL